ncbi:PREDICTED: uncharacterized protein LOC108764621 [Trachymyrmex cornetzi]|uniref:uncharacterized protein LOC108764621 n=1 Tax=Trachymyrmex cornetzi TaxID=471704 RepID=UPI00084F7EC0|nr:PREDICTED: uncharacterized protein LOC108764621 [Trachymyrmex cornetzi]
MVSHATTTVFAGVPPANLLAVGRADNYRWLEAACMRGELPPPSAIEVARTRTYSRVIDQWRERLEWSPEFAGNRIVLTGHWCFNEYLCRIGKEPITIWHHCDAEVDSSPRWCVRTSDHAAGIDRGHAEQRGDVEGGFLLQ